MPDSVLSLDDPVAREPSASGGKAATLARLRGLGLPVPAGAVVTTAAYRRLVDAPEIASLQADLATAVRAGDTGERDAVAADLRAAIRSRSLPDTVRDALDAALPEGPYAVRSSATSEDRPEASFAGQHETRLGVDREALDEAVLACMASLFTDRAVAYRDRADVATGDVAMAVVVQRLVEPDVSGILFTADPITGDRTVAVVDAGPGRGEAQVSGRTTADTLRVDREERAVVEYRIGGDRREPVLDDRDALALATVGARIATALGAPQDVEWAIRDGEIFVLQSRPITALYPVPEPQPTDGRVHVYYSFGHRQGMPDAMPPLVLDLWREETEFVRRQFGLSHRFAATAGGRLYIDLTAYLDGPRLRDRVVRNFDVVDQPAATMLRTLLAARPDEFPLRTRTAGDSIRTLGALRRVLPTVTRFLGPLPSALFEPDPAAELERIHDRYAEECDRAVAAIRAPERLDDRLATAREEFHRALDWLLEPFYGTFLALLSAGWLCRRLVPDAREAVDALALGAENDVVYGMTTALGDLADVAREHGAVATAIRDGATLADLSSVEGGDAFRDALDGFLDEYGFRAVGEIDFSRPRYREDPAPLLNVVAGTLATGQPGAHRRTAEALRERADEAERRLVEAAAPPVRPLVRRLATVYRGYIGVRELPKFALSKLLAELRAQVLAAGEELASAGALPTADDVWLLGFDELQQGVADPRTLAGIDLTGRRREFERDRRVSAPRIVTSDGYVPRAAASGGTDETDERFRGTGAAPGVVEGTVRVVTDPGTDRLVGGEILVAPYTDPGWTPLFANAAAVVTEVGGRLTHGSLVAREYGIPAVVAVEGATTRLRTGDRVRVDGTRGVVERLD